MRTTNATDLSLPVPSLQDLFPQPLTSRRHNDNMSQDPLLTLHKIHAALSSGSAEKRFHLVTCSPEKHYLPQDELHIAELTILPQFAIVFMERTLWIAGKLQRQQGFKDFTQSIGFSSEFFILPRVLCVNTEGSGCDRSFRNCPVLSGVHSSQFLCLAVTLEDPPGICTSPHCARCCPQSLQRCTWHLESPQLHGRVFHWASKGAAAQEVTSVCYHPLTTSDAELKNGRSKHFHRRFTRKDK